MIFLNEYDCIMIICSCFDWYLLVIMSVIKIKNMVLKMVNNILVKFSIGKFLVNVYCGKLIVSVLFFFWR